MKKTTLATLLALVAITLFAFGCKKEEPANTDTATSTDTAVSSSSTTGTTSTDTAATGTTGTVTSMPTSGLSPFSQIT